MRQGDRTSRGRVDQHPQHSATERDEPGNQSSASGAGLTGGPRLRGMIARCARRPLKDALELITYTVSSDIGTHEIEDLLKPGGPYLSLGEMVDLETTIRSFLDKNQQIRTRLRIVRRSGEF